MPTSWNQNTVAESTWVKGQPDGASPEVSATAAPMGFGSQLLSSEWVLPLSAWTEAVVPNTTHTEMTVPSAASWSEVEL